MLPLIAIQGTAAIATAVTTAGLAASRGEAQVLDRLRGMVETLGHANFPLTTAVLSKMRGLSGAHFLAYDADGKLSATTLPGSIDLPADLDWAPPSGSGEPPLLVVGGVPYLAVPARASGDPRSAALVVLYPESNRRQARWEAAWPPLVLGGLSLALMSAVTGWIAHRTGRRIRMLGDEVARLALGDFQPIDPGPGPQEVIDLARSINAMGAELRDLRATIARTERAKVLAQLGAGLAHQLRNSLTGARMSIQLHARRHPPPESDRSLEVALRQLALTEEQVRGLLALGRGEHEPRPAASFDLRRLLADVALLIGPACEHGRVALRPENGEGPRVIAGDEQGLRSAILNLALNAIEAAGPGGSVRLALEDGPEGPAIAVEDDGPGPPRDLAGSVFDPFVTGKPEGVGLGLSLARAVAIRHGGRLSWTRDDGLTRFRLFLPAAAADARETQDRGLLTP
ncbi:MAG: HAMP domain-containing sensor histidine kinase [Isosphaeraceae bacterium]